MDMPLRHPSASRAFTLIELLTVIAIIGVLAAIVIVSVGRVRESSRTSRCGANIRQLQSLALVWASENRDWVPQAMWSHSNIRSLRVGATNLRSVGYSDALGKCDTSEALSPNYGINNKLVQGSDNWGSNDVHFYERGRYKYTQIQGARTIVFAETKVTSGGWSISGAGAFMSAPISLGANHNDKAWVAYADGHVELKSASDLAAISVWTAGITTY